MPAITGNGAGTAQKNPESLSRAFELSTLNFQLAPPRPAESRHFRYTLCIF